MAITTIKRSFHALLWVSSLMLLVRTSTAREFIVGGSSWTLTGNSSAINYNQWAEHNRFQIGDSIVFNYPPGQDSVLQVTREDYSNCTTTSPIHKYSTGHTVFTFSHSGAHYFISGNQDNCHKNQKLVVVVLADRSNMSSNTNQTTTASPPSPMASAPAPVPSGTAETNPTPAPGGSPPKNTASSVHVGSIVFFGALVASSFIVIGSGI